MSLKTKLHGSSWTGCFYMHLCVYQHQYFIYKVSVCQGCCRGLSRRTEGSSYGLCMCLHPIYRVTWEEAQAAISQQPLFAPQNEALQDNEHFKTATPTTPTTCLSQHSDIGRARQRESEGESAGSVKAILSVSVSSRRLNSFHLHPLKKTHWLHNHNIPLTICPS